LVKVTLSHFGSFPVVAIQFGSMAKRRHRIDFGRSKTRESAGDQPCRPEHKNRNAEGNRIISPHLIYFQISIHHVTPSLENISKAILDRINIDDLRAINDPVTTGQDTSVLGLGRIQELIPFKKLCDSALFGIVP
jgi:hypothetical protein